MTANTRRRRREKKENNRTQSHTKQHTPPLFTTPPPHSPTHTTHGNTQTKERQDSARRAGTTRECRTQSEDRAPQQHTTPRLSTRPPRKRKGDTDIRREGHHHTPALQPPCHPTSPCHPTIHDSHPLHHCERGSGQRIPHHTNSTQRHTPQHTAGHGNETVA